jgi:hypothetical protein
VLLDALVWALTHPLQVSEVPGRSAKLVVKFGSWWFGEPFAAIKFDLLFLKRGNIASILCLSCLAGRDTLDIVAS